MLSAVGNSAKLVGRHGVGLLGVAAQPGDKELTQGDKTTSVTASADLTFEVRVQNQGDGTETNVPVKGEIKLPDGKILTATTAITTIAAGKTETGVLSGFAISAEALSRTSVLTITVGPVAGERVKTNNSGSFKILLQLQ
jgi:hypothetical protein